MDANPKVPDSCVALYWGELRMNPGEQRKLGFTYGLGRIAGGKEGEESRVQSRTGQLRLFAEATRYQKPFAVTAYVRGQSPGEKASLALPAGMRFAPGQPAEQPVPPASPAGYSAVSWQVIADRGGRHELASTVPSIGTAKVTVGVREKGLFD
jgi:hypothetical protein